MALDDLSFATEQFIDKSIEGKFVEQHTADIEREKKFGLSTDFYVQNNKSSNVASNPKKHKKSKVEDKNQQNDIDVTVEPEPTVELETAETPSGSQEYSQKRKKHHRRHHQEQEQEQEQ